MFPFIERLIFFLILISTIRSVIRFVQGFLRGHFGTQARPRVSYSGGGGGAAGTTMLQQDPVCGTYVAIDTSLKRILNGKVVHFCSPECRDKYHG